MSQVRFLPHTSVNLYVICQLGPSIIFPSVCLLVRLSISLFFSSSVVSPVHVHLLNYPYVCLLLCASVCRPLSVCLLIFCLFMVIFTVGVSSGWSLTRGCVWSSVPPSPSLLIVAHNHLDNAQHSTAHTTVIHMCTHHSIAHVHCAHRKLLHICTAQ